jgi:hypothetical protein
MPDEAPAGLEEPLLQARERPALDGERQDEPAQEITNEDSAGDLVRTLHDRGPADLR